jgi:hypothetical protein
MIDCNSYFETILLVIGVTILIIRDKMYKFGIAILYKDQNIFQD